MFDTASPSTMTTTSIQEGVLRFKGFFPALVLVVAYFLAGKLGQLLAISPGYATAIWPPSGIALAGILILGYRAWPCILLGSFLVHVSITFDASTFSTTFLSIALPLIIGSGAAIQAVVAAFLVQRFGGFPNTMTREKEIFSLLFLGGLVASLVNATLSVSALLASGRILVSNFWANWGTWWIGDAMGVFIFTPLVLVWFLHPQETWRERRVMFIVPVAITFFLVTLIVIYGTQWERNRLKSIFDQRVAEISYKVEKSLNGYTEVLRSLESFHAASGRIDREKFQVFAKHHLIELPSLQALEWGSLVNAAGRAEFEKATRREGFPDFQITERTADGHIIAAADRPEYVSIQYIEPFHGNEKALGYDVNSDPVRRKAIDLARDTGKPAATNRIKLIQDKKQEFSILIFQPVYRNGFSHETLNDRRRSIHGYMVGVFKVSHLLDTFMQSAKEEGIFYRFIDKTAPADEQLLSEYGGTLGHGSFVPDDKESSSNMDHFKKEISIIFGQRQWILETLAGQKFIATHRSENAWLILVIGFLLTSLVGTISLMISGRTLMLRHLNEERMAVLKQSENKLRETQRIAHIGTCYLNFSSKQVVWSDEVYKIYGFDPTLPPPSYIEYQKLFVSESWFSFSAAMSDTIDTGIPCELELEIIRKDGSRGWIWIRGEKILGTPDVIDGFYLVVQDITQRKQSGEMLRKSEEHFRAYFYRSMVGMATTSVEKKWINVNDALCKSLGYSREELMRMTWDELTYPEDLASDLTQFDRMLRGEIESYAMEKRFVHKNGNLVYTQLAVSCVRLSDGSVEYVVALVEDITERKHSEEELQLAASVFSYAKEGIMLTDIDGLLIDVNQAFIDITGYEKAEVLGKNSLFLSSNLHDKSFYQAMYKEIKEYSFWSGEIRIRHKNGEIYSELLTISTVRDNYGQPWRYVGLFIDITPIKEQQKQLELMAHFDLLTGLPNRTSLNRYLQQGMNHSQRHQRMMAVVFIDLDNFKVINDTYGHDVGDSALKVLSSGMQQVMRAGDTLARIGGDEFVAVLLDLEDLATCEQVLQRLLATIAGPIDLAEMPCHVTASIGVSFYPQNNNIDAEQLLRQADQAMYQAKLFGKNRYQLFDTKMENDLREHHEKLRQIVEALALEQFELFYQPKINMRSGAIVGAEALIRWQHPQQGMLLPAAFLKIIEHNPLDIQIGEWVLETTLRQIGDWQARGLNLTASVNISPYHLQQSNFTQRLRDILARHPNVDPSCLELEVLESGSFDNMAYIIPLLDECQEIGVKFALDDFGTGYSSLNYLKQLPLTHLKIDRTFVRDILDDPNDLAILEGIIRISEVFSFTVIAEGVETIEHGEILLMLGCELAQGYGIAHPLPATELFDWIAKWQPNNTWKRTLELNYHDQGLLLAYVQLRAWLKSLSVSGVLPDLSKWRLTSWLEDAQDTALGKLPAFQDMKSLLEQTQLLLDDYVKNQNRMDEVAANATLAALSRLPVKMIAVLKDLGWK